MNPNEVFMSNIICSVPFCKNPKHPRVSKCYIHMWENRKFPAFKEVLPFWAVRNCQVHGYLISSKCYIKSTHKNKHSYQCIKCANIKARKKYIPKKRYDKHLKNYDSTRNRHLIKTYGITTEDYERLLSKQNGCCAICLSTNKGRKDKYFNVDHCHNSGKVRGLLCWKCNTAIGLLGDTEESLQKVLCYLSH
jgi:hypothetical protein